jgi:hypothetical protein
MILRAVSAISRSHSERPTGWPCRKGIVDIGVAERRKRLCETRIVGLLALVEAQIFEERDLAGFEGGDNALRLGADAVRRKSHRSAADRAAQRLDDCAQRLRRIRPLRPPEMRHDDNLGAFRDQRLDGRRQALDTRRIGDLAVLDRDVQIGADQHALPPDIEIVERAEPRHGPLPFFRTRRVILQSRVFAIPR